METKNIPPFATRRVLQAALIVALGATAHPALADTYYWDATDPIQDAGFGTAAGTWGSNSSWSTSSNGTATTGILGPTTGDDLNFGYASSGLAAGTLTVTGTQTAGNLTFAAGSGAIGLSGGTINFAALSNNSTITVNNAANTIWSVITSDGTLTKTGTGTLTLDPGAGQTDTLEGLKISDGSMVLNSGSLSLTRNNGNPEFSGFRLGGSNNPSFTLDGGTLLTSGAATVGGDALRGKGVFTINSGTWTHGGSVIAIMYGGGGSGSIMNVNGGQVTVAGVIRVGQNSGNATLNLNGGATSVTGLDNSGSTAIVNFNGGTLRTIANSGNFTAISRNGTMTPLNVLAGGAVLDTNGFNISVLSPLVAGSPSGGLTKNGVGTLTLTGTNTYTGATTINAGALSVSTDVNLGSGGGITLNGGTLQTTGSSAFSSSRAISVTGNSEIDASNTAGTTLTGLVTGGSALTKKGSGSLTFSSGVGNTNTLAGLKLTSGQVNINSGGLNITGTGVQDPASGLWVNGGNLTVAGGVLSTTGLVTLQTGTLTVSSGTFTSARGLLNAYGGTATTTVSGGLLDINGNLRVSQSGTGTVNLDGGTVQLNIFESVGSTGTVNFNGATVLARASSTDFTQTANTTYNVKAGGAIIDTAGFNITAAADLRAGSPSGGLTKNGAGTLTLTGNNTYTGLTTVVLGTLRINGANSGNGAVTVDSGATLAGSGSVIGGINVSGVLAPGANSNSIESFGGGALSFGSIATYAYQMQTLALNGDLAYSSGNLNIASGATLSLTDLSTSTALENGAKLTLISYAGAWNNGVFSYNSATLENGSEITLGANKWMFKYDDTLAGTNFSSDTAGASNFVTMTVVPEPSVAAMLGGISTLLLLRRRRA